MKDNNVFQFLMLLGSSTDTHLSLSNPPPPSTNTYESQPCYHLQYSYRVQGSNILLLNKGLKFTIIVPSFEIVLRFFNLCIAIIATIYTLTLSKRLSIVNAYT